VHRTPEQLEAGLDLVRRAPAVAGTLELIVRRPAPRERQVLDRAELDERAGLVGDRWKPKRSRSRGELRFGDQITVTSARMTALIANGSDPEGWAPAGDQLFVDLDLSHGNLPTGSRLAVGQAAVLEVTADPHLGCGKYARRYGAAALRFVRTEVGRSLRLRGLHARVITPGTVRRGDPIRKLAAA
jgi:hypothetical protein